MKSWNHSDSVLPSVPRRTHGTLIRFLTAALATLLIVFGLESSFPSLQYRLLPWLNKPHKPAHPTPSGTPIDWSSLPATESFEFHSCYHDFECARLKLPLDYFNGTYPDSTIGLAITKLPARVPVDDPRYGGPILVNPGGPGGPGALFAVGVAKLLQSIVDSAEHPDSIKDLREKEMSSAKYFDIIGFDPRGIGWTEPSATCMLDGPSSWSWKLRESSEGILGSSDAALGRLWSMTHAFGSSCKQAMDEEDGPDIKRYMTTASVARDMLEIVERHAEYVAEQATQLMAEKARERPQPTHSKSQRQKPDASKLQYWGFSYGTYIGSTFASMFPNRVKRLVLDGVVNSEDYNANLGNGSLHDAEKAMSSFYTFCLLSGPELCPLTTSASSAKDIEERVQNIVQSLYHHPIAITSAAGPEVLTYSDIKGLLFSAIYQPVTAFPLVAQVLAALEAGGGSVLEELAQGLRPSHIYSCPINGSSPLVFSSDFLEFAVLCSDGVEQTTLEIDSFEEYWHLLEDISPTCGAIWSMLRMKCASWKIRAVHKFGDDFGSNTSHPILWISNTADPVTPLRSGKIMSEKFPGSVQLVQDSAGHCSISTPTPCTLVYIREYFQLGTLPPRNTMCIPPSSPFSLNSTDPDSPFYDCSLARSGVTIDGVLLAERGVGIEEEKKMMKAAKSVQQWVAENEFFGRLHTNQRADSMLARLSRERVAL